MKSATESGSSYSLECEISSGRFCQSFHTSAMCGRNKRVCDRCLRPVPLLLLCSGGHACSCFSVLLCDFLVIARVVRTIQGVSLVRTFSNA